MDSLVALLPLETLETLHPLVALGALHALLALDVRPAVPRRVGRVSGREVGVLADVGLALGVGHVEARLAVRTHGVGDVQVRGLPVGTVLPSDSLVALGALGTLDVNPRVLGRVVGVSGREVGVGADVGPARLVHLRSRRLGHVGILDVEVAGLSVGTLGTSRTGGTLGALDSLVALLPVGLLYPLRTAVPGLGRGGLAFLYVAQPGGVVVAPTVVVARYGTLVPGTTLVDDVDCLPGAAVRHVQIVGVELNAPLADVDEGVAAQVVVVDSVVVHPLARRHVDDVGVLPRVVGLTAELYELVFCLRGVVLHGGVTAHAEMVLAGDRQRHRAAGVRQVYVMILPAVLKLHGGVVHTGDQTPIVAVLRHLRSLADDVARAGHGLVAHVEVVRDADIVVLGKEEAPIIAAWQLPDQIYPTARPGIARVAAGESELSDFQLCKIGLPPRLEDVGRHVRPSRLVLPQAEARAVKQRAAVLEVGTLDGFQQGMSCLVYRRVVKSQRPQGGVAVAVNALAGGEGYPLKKRDEFPSRSGDIRTQNLVPIWTILGKFVGHGRLVGEAGGNLLRIEREIQACMIEGHENGHVVVCVSERTVALVGLGDGLGDVCEEGCGGGGAPCFGIGRLDWKQGPFAQRLSRELNQARGDGKRPDIGNLDIKHFGRRIGARQIEIGPCVGILVSEGVAGRQLTRLIGDITVCDDDATNVGINIEILGERGEEVEQPTPLVTVEKSCVLLKLAFGVDTIFLGIILDLHDIVRMFCRVFRIAIGAKGIYAAEGVFEQYPLLLLAADV